MTAADVVGDLADALVGEHLGVRVRPPRRCSGSSGQPGVTATYPASSKTAAHRSQLLASSQSPWTKTTGVLSPALARATSSASCALIACASGTRLISFLIGLGRRGPRTTAGRWPPTSRAG